MTTDKARGSRRSRQDSGSDKRGFASMDKDKQREIARKGGEHAHDNDSRRRR